MTDPAETTLREVVIELRAAVKTLEKAVERLNEKTVSLDVYGALERRVDDLESTYTWAIRLVVGMVITALVGLVIFQGGK